MTRPSPERPQPDSIKWSPDRLQAEWSGLNERYFAGLLPAIAIARLPLRWRGIRVEAIARGKLLAAVVLLMVGTVLAFGGFYASFLREHKSLRSFANPGYFIYSAVKFSTGSLAGFQ